MSRREERERRRALKLQKFEETKATIIAKVAQDHRPLIASNLSDKLRVEKVPKAAKDGSRFHLRVTWDNANADRKDEWSWGELRDWADQEWHEIILPALTEFAGLTWAEVDRIASGSGHKMHHSHEIGDLIKEAQQRWIELDLEQYDTVFRFRLGGTRRLWGFVVHSRFQLIWWDRHHSIYPVD